MSINNQSFDLYKIKVRSLGFKKATKLKYIYKNFIKKLCSCSTGFSIEELDYFIKNKKKENG